MPRWLGRLLRRIHDLARRGRVRFTYKAVRELAALGSGLDAQDACDVLAGLTADDFAERLESNATKEWMYVFKPSVAGSAVYVKLILRAECVILSFHTDEGEPDEDQP
jgi:Motility quorum-sensing regulator, toxin of MqsA